MFFDRLILERLMDEMEEKAKQLTINPVSVSLSPSIRLDALVLNVYMSANGVVYNQNTLIPQNELVKSKSSQKLLMEELLNVISKLTLKANNGDRTPKIEVSNNTVYKSVW